MAEPLGPQERLNRIVQQIAVAMTAQVCSVYVLRDDDVLELFATFGLNPTAVHMSQLKVGRGLVGTIAAMRRPLNLPDAQQHPAFAYLPETGEEIYKSFLGVPMTRAGRSLGVLVVQTRESRRFGTEEVEALETAAMVLSDLVATGELKGLSQQGTDLVQTRPIMLNGLRLSPGIGIGRVVLHEPRVVVENLIAEDSDTELQRLAVAIRKMRRSVDAMLENRDMGGEGDHVDVLESYRMFAHDRGWVKRIEAAIAQGLTAEAATQKVSQDNRRRLVRSGDSYLRERLTDFDDLTRRLMKELMGEAQPSLDEEGDFIVVARDMGAAELLDYSRPGLRGVVLEEATATSHVAIVARALGLAVVGKVEGAVARCEMGNTIIADGDSGCVHIRPPDELLSSYDERIALREQRQARYIAARHEPSVTRDGTPIELLVNAGLAMDLPQIEATGAAGVGLFRTELQFMVSSSMPRVDAQAKFYRSILDAANGKPVTFRTLDIGGDKLLPYLRMSKEDNPALGWRAIRLAIDRPGLIRVQLRALLKAAAGEVLRVKLPMITDVSEVAQVRTLLNREIEARRKLGHDMPSTVHLGAMIEVPSLLWQLDELMQSVDFASVGSNDLFQFMAASDRTNSYLANRFNPLSRPFMRALREIARAADRNQTHLQICGEMAGEPIAAMALMGIGYRAVSMSPVAIGPVKEMVRMVDLSDLSQTVNRLVDEKGAAQTLTEALTDYADQHGVPI
ncbi:MAG: phosphoenolpyruvate--protein phosphotransferase [Ahrensia sp.]|nr:phosphoenolpyruvate--protein phosphotransferase [Ahrensia sp.]